MTPEEPRYRILGQPGEWTRFELREKVLNDELAMDAELEEVSLGQKLKFSDLLPIPDPHSVEPNPPADDQSGSSGGLPSMSSVSEATSSGPQVRVSSPSQRTLWAFLVMFGGIGLCCGIPAWVLLPQIREAQFQGRQTANLARIKALSTAVLSYAAQNNDVMPPSMSPADLRRVLVSTTGERIRTRPPRGQEGEYRSNPNLAGQKISRFESPGTLIFFFETRAWRDGRQAVSFLDSSARYVPEERLTESQNRDWRLGP